MKYYLCGPMTNVPNFNFAVFNAAKLRLEHLGHIVFSPVEQDLKRYGPSFFQDNPTGDVAKAQKDFGFSLREVLAESLLWICNEAEGIAMLPKWEKSNGSFSEWATARALGLKFLYL